METVASEVMMELVHEVLLGAGVGAEVLVLDAEMGTEEGVMEIPIGKGLRTQVVIWT